MFIGRGAMPVHNTRRRVVWRSTREELYHCLAANLRAAASLFRREDLPPRMTVPIGPSAGFKTEAKGAHVG